MEKIIYELYRKNNFTSNDIDFIEDKINGKNIETLDLFEDFVTYVRDDKKISEEKISFDILLDYSDNYQNLLTHKENLDILL